MATPHN